MDQHIKTLKIRVKDKNGEVIQTTTVIEKDVIDFVYRKNNKNVSSKGELIKIGIKNNKYYIVVLDYNFANDDNVHFVYTSDIVKIVNVVHSGEQYSFSPVYSSDESILLLRQRDGILEYTKDGSEWEQTVTPDSMTDLVYSAMKNMGYVGSVEDMAKALKDLCENSENIVAFEFIDE